jgi:hypothetical protein
MGAARTNIRARPNHVCCGVEQQQKKRLVERLAGAGDNDFGNASAFPASQNLFPPFPQSPPFPLLTTEIPNGCDLHVIDVETAAWAGDHVEARRPHDRAARQLGDHDPVIVVSREVAKNAKFVVIEVALQDDQTLLELLAIHVVTGRTAGRSEYPGHRLNVFRAHRGEEQLDSGARAGTAGRVEAGRRSCCGCRGRRRSAHRTGTGSRRRRGTRACGEHKKRKQSLLHTVLHESLGEPKGQWK